MKTAARPLTVDFNQGDFDALKIDERAAFSYIQRVSGKSFFYEILAFMKFHKKADLRKPAFCILCAIQRAGNGNTFLFEKRGECDLFATAFCGAKTEPIAIKCYLWQ